MMNRFAYYGEELRGMRNADSINADRVCQMRGWTGDYDASLHRHTEAIVSAGLPVGNSNMPGMAHISIPPQASISGGSI